MCETTEERVRLMMIERDLRGYAAAVMVRLGDCAGIAYDPAVVRPHHVALVRLWGQRAAYGGWDRDILPVGAVEDLDRA